GRADGGDQFGGSGDPADLPAGEGEGLAGTGDGDRAVAHAGEGGQGDVFGVVEDEVFVDLVGHDEEVPFHGQLGDRRQLRAGEDRAGGVVRGVDQQHAGAVGDGVAQFVEVEPEAAVPGAQGDRDAAAARHGDAGRVGVVVRLQGDHLVAGFHQGEQGGGDGLGGAGGDQDLGVGVRGEAVAALLVGGDGGAQFGDAGARRVLVAAAVPQRAHGGLPDLFGTVGVGEALAEVDRPGAQAQ